MLDETQQLREEFELKKDVEILKSLFLDEICTTIADTRPEKMNKDVDRLIKV